MRQIELLKEDLAKQYGVNIEDFLTAYEEGMKLKEMPNHFETSIWNIKMVASTLNLRLAQKHRSNDITMLGVRSNDKVDDDLIGKLKEQEDFLDQLNHDYAVQAKALIRNRHQTNYLRKALRNASASEGVYNFISEVVKEVTPIKRPKQSPRVKVTNEGKIQFAVLSDFHCEELVDSAQVPSGEYSWGIMESRVKKIFSELLINNSGFATLDFYILGDMINGFIHGSDVNASRHPIVALTNLSELLAEELAKISLSYNELRVFTTTGNHDRLNDEPSIWRYQKVVLL